MSLRQRKAFKALAVFLAFSFAQVYVQTSFAEPGGSSVGVPLPQQLVARLTTRGGPVTVNGASAANGATLLTGATLETPDQVSATIDLGPLGTIDVDPNSSIVIDFDANGNVRVKVLRGCARVNHKGAGTGEMYTAEGASQKTDKDRKMLNFCYLNGQLNPAQTAASTTGAGSTAGGLSTTAKVVIIGGIAGGTIAIVAGTRGSNPSL